MKTSRFLLFLMTIGASSSTLAQSKGQMPFTSSSPNANQLIRKAWVAMSDAKMEEGNQYLQQVLEEDPTCAMAYVSFAAGADDGAENVSKAEAMKLSPDETLFIKGLRASREKSEAHTYFAPLLKKYPKDDYLHFIVMFFLYKQGPGIAIGENIVRRNPKFAPVHNLLGYEYMGQNDLTKALYHFDKYISMKPDLANPYDSKGDFLMHTGKTEEAIKLYEKASSLGMAASKAKAEDAKAKLKYPVLSPGDEAEIKAILSASIDAYEQGDAEALLKDYSPQSVKIWGNQAVNVGLANVREVFPGRFKYAPYTKFDGSIELVGGVGSIAIAQGKVESIQKDVATEQETALNQDFIYLLRKRDGEGWKILADHFYGEAHGNPLTDEDRKSIEKLLHDWDNVHQLGGPITKEHLPTYAALHSPQIIEIYPNQVTNIGTGNLLARLEFAIGLHFEKSLLNPIAIEGVGRRAVAWGIMSQVLLPKGSDKPISRQYPWAMMLTKEADGIWRVLVVHGAP